MKKFQFAVLLVLFLAIGLGFTACGNMATLEFNNDTSNPQTFVVRINGEWQDSVTLRPSATQSYNNTDGIEYAVYRSRLNTAGWYIWQGSVSAGETVTLRFSEANDN
jgi:hypothetical protein